MVTTAPKGSDLTILAKCSVLPAKSCGTNVTRFWSLTDFADYWPGLGIPGGKTKMISFLDSLLDPNAKPKIPPQTRNFTYLYAEWSANGAFVRAYNDEQDGAGLWCNSTGHPDIILNATNLTVTGTWTPNADSSCSLANVSITTTFPNGKSLTQSYNLKSLELKKNRYIMI